jgi:hypothetical protein
VGFPSAAVGVEVSVLSASRWARLLVELPDRLIVLFGCAVFTVGPVTTFGQFRIWLVLPIFVVLATLCWRLVPQRVEVSTRSKTGACCAVLIAVVWVVFNAAFVSEYFILVRDPAVYTLRAIWLSHHASPNIPTEFAVQGARGVPGAITDTGGFFQHGSQWEPQGPSLVPALLAIGGWLAGVSGVLAANLFIGGIALLVLYAFGRRILGPIWALVPVLALATSMPMVAFSRAPYTEPTALILALGGLVLLWSALQTERILFAGAAGLILGATFLARPDGLFVVLGVTLALGVVTTCARSAARRSQLRRTTLTFLVGAGLSLALAFVDLARNSAPYEVTSWSQIKPLTELTVACAIAVVIFSFVPIPTVVRSQLAAHRERLGRITALVVLFAFAALSLRPLYFTAHSAPDVVGAPEIASRQAAAHLAVDGTRTYDENTLTWLSWYFSWPVVVSAGIGLAAMTLLTWRRRDPQFAVLLGVIGVSSAMYLNRSAITPDQIWAMRRFVPIIIPIGLVAAVGVPYVLWQRRQGNRVLRRFAVLGAVFIAVVPALAWRSTLTTRQFGGARAFVANICDLVAGSNVIISDQGPGGTIFLPALRVQCGVQAVLASVPSSAALLAIRANWGSQRGVVVISFLQNAAPWTVVPQKPNLVGRSTVWNEPLLSRPTGAHSEAISVYVGDLRADGLVVPREA